MMISAENQLLKEQMETCLGASISLDKFYSHKAHMRAFGYETFDDYFDAVYGTSTPRCVRCKNGALTIMGPDTSDQGILWLDDDSFICRGCWIDIGLEKEDWQSFLEYKMYDRKRWNAEQEMTSKQRHEKQERKKVTAGFTRKIHEMDEYACVYCGVRRNLLIEHVMPVSRSGVTSEDNCVTACQSCNAKKGNKTASEANMTLTFGRFAGSEEGGESHA